MKWKTLSELASHNSHPVDDFSFIKRARQVSFVGKNHMMIINTASVARMAHFAVAFFGYHLQGREDLQWYFSEEFVDQYGDLFWGIVADGS